MTGYNLLAWCLQVAGVILAAGMAIRLLRLAVPRARLWYWQVVLLVCLTLPLVRPWKHEAPDGSITITMSAGRPLSGTAHAPLPLAEIVLALLAAGVLVRIVWLAIGFWRLRQYRREGQLLATRDGVKLLLCGSVASPVTFGVWRPVVLLPEAFTDFDSATREAMLCHELLHVRRRDWLYMVGEEIIRSIFWFHPAIWWLLEEIGLAREQEVDRQVIRQTQARDTYVDTLLTMAGVVVHTGLAPAPLFLRRRHLKQRVVLILKEVRMSRTRIITSLATALLVVAVAGWLVTGALPLAAADSQAPQAAAPNKAKSDQPAQQAAADSAKPAEAKPEKAPEPAKTAETPASAPAAKPSLAAPSEETLPAPAAPPSLIHIGGNVQSAKLVSQPRPIYPAEAKQARIQGVVKLDAIIGKDGTVQNISVISGHPLLVPAALDAVQNWVYQITLLNGEPVGVETEIDVNFTLSQ